MSSRFGRDTALMALAYAIVAGDEGLMRKLLEATPGLAKCALLAGATRAAPVDYFMKEISHYLYTGDTALHVAAAAYRPALVGRLVAEGADVGARNRRGAQALHYAADGGPTLRTWNPRAQAETIARLIELGALPNSFDKSGVAPLHRAVRTRCTAAVKALLEGGADPRLKNKSGSTPMDLARLTTGRGGSGTPEARAEQAKIVRLLGALKT
jgi:ankyrin repeat protein